MSILALCMALILVSMHACNARLISGYKKDIAKETKLEYDILMDVKDSPAFEDTKETILRGKIITMTMSNEKQLPKEMQVIERNARSILESESHVNQETADANEDDEPVEDAVVMDYVQPHRKSPIHNHHL